jgi:hypothetical protein
MGGRKTAILAMLPAGPHRPAVMFGISALGVASPAAKAFDWPA